MLSIWRLLHNTGQFAALRFVGPRACWHAAQIYTQLNTVIRRPRVTSARFSTRAWAKDAQRFAMFGADQRCDRRLAGAGKPGRPSIFETGGSAAGRRQ
jgi:hypothetical protein